MNAQFRFGDADVGLEGERGFDDLVRSMRLGAGLTCEQLAQRLGCGPTAIERMEATGCEPSVDTLLRVIRATDPDLLSPLWPLER